MEGNFEEGTCWELLSGIIDRSSCWGQLLIVWVLFSQEGYIKDWVVEVWGEAEEGGLGT